MLFEIVKRNLKESYYPISEDEEDYFSPTEEDWDDINHWYNDDPREEWEKQARERAAIFKGYDLALPSPNDGRFYLGYNLSDLVDACESYYGCKDRREAFEKIKNGYLTPGEVLEAAKYAKLSKFNESESYSLFIPFLDGQPKGSFTDLESAIKYAKDNDCEEIEQHIWYNEEDYGETDSDKVSIVWRKSDLNESDIYYIGPKEYGIVKSNDEDSDCLVMYLNDNAYAEEVIPKNWTEDKIRKLAGKISKSEGPRGNRDFVQEVEDEVKKLNEGYSLGDDKESFDIWDKESEKLKNVCDYLKDTLDIDFTNIDVEHSQDDIYSASFEIKNIPEAAISDDLESDFRDKYLGWGSCIDGIQLEKWYGKPTCIVIFDIGSANSDKYSFGKTVKDIIERVNNV